MTASYGAAVTGNEEGGLKTAPSGPTQQQWYQVYPFYTGFDNACQNAIYLLPPGWGAYGGTVQAFTIPLLYGGPSGALPAAIGNDDFTLTFSGPKNPPYTPANVTVQVTITGKNAWNCAAAARQTLMNNFTSFLLALEASATLVPGGIQTVVAQVADWMPAPLAETLFWRYSLSSGFYPNTIPYVDVRPGMRLRVDAEATQFVNPGAPQNGYVAGSRLAFSVGSMQASGGARVVTFDPLLGAIKAPTVTPPSQQPSMNGKAPGGTAVASGAFDLQPSGGARAYWRLLFPSSVPSPYEPGDVSIGDNVVLLGAPTLAALNQATSDYPNKIDTSGNPPNVYVTFLGRALAAPEIEVFLTLVNGPRWLEWVPIGTTFANIIERFSPLPMSPSQRLIGNNGFMRPSTASPSGQATVQVALTVDDRATSSTLAALPPAMFDLPLIAGDSITLNV
jgi:hypothetical protein